MSQCWSINQCGAVQRLWWWDSWLNGWYARWCRAVLTCSSRIDLINCYHTFGTLAFIVPDQGKQMGDWFVHLQPSVRCNVAAGLTSKVYYFLSDWLQLRPTGLRWSILECSFPNKSWAVWFIYFSSPQLSFLLPEMTLIRPGTGKTGHSMSAADLNVCVWSKH